MALPPLRQFSTGEIQSDEILVRLINEDVRFHRRDHGGHPQHRRLATLVPIIANCPKFPVVAAFDFWQIVAVQFFLLDVVGDVGGDANEALGDGTGLPVHQVLEHGQRIGFCRVYDVLSGADPAAVPTVAPGTVERRVFWADDAVDASDVVRRGGHADRVRSLLRLHDRQSRSTPLQTAFDHRVPGVHWP